ncbi:MAG: hypothetical protein ACREI9_05695 [Nitrospiraceae bacterium]
MQRYLKVRVGEGEMRIGRRNHLWLCPIALAVMRLMPDAVGIRVNVLGLIEIAKRDRTVARYQTPDDVRRWIAAWDSQRDVEPIEFWIGVIE